MSESENKSELVSKDISVSQISAEVPKPKKKFSILLVSTNNDAKVEIDGKKDSSHQGNTNLITFAKEGKTKKNLRNVLKDVNSNLTGMENDLRRSLKTFNSPPQKKQQTFRSQNFQQEPTSLRQNDNFRNPTKVNRDSYEGSVRGQELAQSNDHIYMILKENTILKQQNKRLENELNDYKKYLENLSYEKK